jgi:hypothetical protein
LTPVQSLVPAAISGNSAPGKPRQRRHRAGQVAIRPTLRQRIRDLAQSRILECTAGGCSAKRGRTSEADRCAAELSA